MRAASRLRKAGKPVERGAWRGPEAGKAEPAGGLVLALALGAAAALAAFALYLGTLAPTVLPYSLPDLADATMLQMQACSLSMVHPTGYPTWTMLSHLFTYLPFGDCAYRANLSSAVFSALAVGAVYAAGYLLTRSAIGAAVGAVAFGLTSIFWSQAVIAEVYNPNAFFSALALIALIVWRKRQRDRYLLISAFLVGLAMTNHLTSGLLLPGALLLVLLVDGRRLLDPRLMLKSAGMFLLGLTPYLFLPLRAPSAPMKANNPDNLERFLYVLTGGDLTGGFFSFGPVELIGRVGMYAEYLLVNFNLVLLLAGVCGLVALALRDVAVAVFTAFLFFGWGFHAIGNDIVDVQLYFIPTYVIFAVWICCGVAALLGWLAEFGRGAPRGVYGAVISVICAGLLLLPFAGVREAYAANDYSQSYEAAETLDTVAASAERDATILHLRSPLWYMTVTEDRRQDLTLVDPFQNPEPGRYNDVVWPGDHTPEENERIYGAAGDTTGVEAARKAAERGPVYLLAHEGLDTEPLRQAGFRLEAQGDSFYKLIPPDGEA